MKMDMYLSSSMKIKKKYFLLMSWNLDLDPMNGYRKSSACVVFFEILSRTQWGKLTRTTNYWLKTTTFFLYICDLTHLLVQQIYPVLFRSQSCKAKLFQEAMFFHHHFYLPEVNILDQNGNGVLSSLVPCLKPSTPSPFWTCIFTSGK